MTYSRQNSGNRWHPFGRCSSKVMVFDNEEAAHNDTGYMGISIDDDDDEGRP